MARQILAQLCARRKAVWLGLLLPAASLLFSCAPKPPDRPRPWPDGALRRLENDLDARRGRAPQPPRKP